MHFREDLRKAFGKQATMPSISEKLGDRARQTQKSSARALDENRIIISSDMDFGDLIAARDLVRLRFRTGG
jgi:predicted nuclease of predicted toxin-antitoxin system